MTAPFNRHVGLMILDVTMSNPNGDPDMESEPRTRELDRLGMISPVSLKRKFRDLVSDESEVYLEAKKELNLGSESGNLFGILEDRGRDLKDIRNTGKEEFTQAYWDARLFGNTILGSFKDNDQQKKKQKEGGYDHFINTGVVQVGVGMSIAPIDIVRMTNSNKSGVEDGKSCGLAPLAFRVVQHGIYCIPIYVNPSIAKKTGATSEDLELLKFMMPYVYQHTTSTIRPQISVLHAWFAEHKNTLGSCPEHKFIDALTPRIKEGVISPSSKEDYVIPGLDDLGELAVRFKNIQDLVDD